MDKLCIHRVSVAILLLLVKLLATSSGETVYINDGETLEGYLCSPSGTITTNTTLFLNNSYLDIEHYGFCLVENTSDITIAAAPELGENGIKINLTLSRLVFFNITNLIITSITLRTNTPAADIPPSALRYINDTNQFLYYDKDTDMGILFNHCSNVTIHNLNFNASSWLSIIGVNLCGYSCIDNPDNDRMLLYYLDTVLISSEQCDLHVQFRLRNFDGALMDLSNLLRSRSKQISVEMFDTFALILTQQKFNANVSITLIPGTDNNKAFILFVNSVTDSHIKFQGHSYDYCITRFIDYGFPLLSVYFYETPNFSGSVDHIIKSLQIENTSLNELQVLKFPGQLSHQIALVNVSWCDKGWAIYNLLQIIVSSKEEGNLYVNMKNVHLQRHRFLDNFVIQDSVYFANIRNITMTGTNFFNAGNGGSVINVISSNLTLTGDLTVSSGNAFQGGGIRLDESSTLFLKEPLRAQFINNTAYQGSAIYAAIRTKDLQLLQTSSPIQVLPNQVYSLHNISNISIALHFENNLDETLNRIVSMHAPQLNFLYNQTFLFYRKFWDEPHSQYAYTTLFDAMFKADDTDKYTSLSNGICTQVRKEPWNCTYIDLYYHKLLESLNVTDVLQYLLQIHTYPGEEVFSVLHTGNQDFSIESCETHLIVKSEYYSLTRSTSTLLFTFFNKKKEDLCFIIFVSNRGISQILKIPFIQVHMNATCPPGFYLNHEGYCDCVSTLQSHHYKCNISSRIFTSHEGYWTGYNATSYTITFSSHCPPDYCNQSFHNFLLDNSITDLSCLNNRTGILCGQCKRENYTVHSAIFGSDACSDDCTDVYLLTLLAYALAGPLLVAILFALKLTVAVGTINGVIFYANILGLSMDKLTEGHRGPHLTFLRIVISLLNLDLGFPLCFYKGMTTTDKVGLQFVFPMYIWGIVIGMIIVAKYSIRFANCISNSAVQVLATLFYLSFPKLLLAVIDITTYSTINLVVFNESNNSYVNREQTVWFYNGEEYGKGVHGFYLFLASVFILFFLLYTILTTFSSCFMRFKLVNKFKPLIDAYGGPFKDKWRFWFGLRLWITVLIFSVSGTLRGTDYNGPFIFNFIILSIFILIQSFARPFKSRLILLMDLFFMINYWLIILFQLVFKSIFLRVYIFLLSAAVLVLVLVLFSHFCYVCIYSKNPGVFLQVKTKFNRRFVGYERIEDQANEEEADIQIFNAAEEREQVLDTY